MKGTDPQVALEVLTRVRQKDFPEVDGELLEQIFLREHEFQFEDDRGQVRAALRDLIDEATAGEKK